MSHLSISRSVLFGSILLSLIASATATTYVVDAAGGGQFTDLPAAVAFAQTGDVLLVQAGTYSPFTLSKGLAILGYGSVSVVGAPIVISGIPAGDQAAFVHATCTTLSLSDNDGPVLLQELDVSNAIDVARSLDVRVLASTATTTDQLMYVPSGLRVEDSRVEVVSSTLSGQHAGLGFCGCYAEPTDPFGDGSPGLSVLGAGSRAHFALSNARGGDGCCANAVGQAGSAGPGIYVGSGSELIGAAPGEVRAGVFGTNYHYANCAWDGHGASAIDNQGLLWHGGLTLVPGSTPTAACTLIPQPPIGGAGTANAFDSPTLAITGTPVSGGVVQLTIRGLPGATTDLWIGRRAIVQPTANVLVEELLPKNRVVHLGALPASGERTVSLVINSVLPAGTTIVAQAELTLAGELRRSNSIPMLVR
jgi:hypothetical protein